MPNIDWQKIFELLPFAVGALRPGSPNAGAFMRGGLETNQYLRQQRMERDRYAQEDQYRQAQLANMQADNARQQEQLELQKKRDGIERLLRGVESLNPAIESAAESSFDPAQAENQILQRAQALEGALGLPGSALSGFVPPMAPRISRRKMKRAQELYERAEKTYGQEAIANDAITLQTGELFGDVKPSQLRAIFEAPAMNAQGQSATPYVKPAARPTSGSFEEYVDATPERQAQVEAARKRYQQSDDRPPQGATVVIQTVDANGNPVTKIVPKTAGAEFAAPPTGQQRQQVAENEAVTMGLARLRELAPDTQTLAKWVGPVRGRTNQAALVTPGIDVNPQMAEFFAEVAAIKNRMIRAITGAQMSEPEAKRIMAQLPDVTLKPGVFLARLQATERNLGALNARIAAQSGAAPTSQRQTKDPLGIR